MYVGLPEGCYLPRPSPPFPRTCSVSSRISTTRSSASATSRSLAADEVLSFYKGEGQKSTISSSSSSSSSKSLAAAEALSSVSMDGQKGEATAAATAAPAAAMRTGCCREQALQQAIDCRTMPSLRRPTNPRRGTCCCQGFAVGAPAWLATLVCLPRILVEQEMCRWMRRLCLWLRAEMCTG